MLNPRFSFLVAIVACFSPHVVAFAQGLPLTELRALRPSGVHPSGIEYFQPVMYASALFAGHDAGSWVEFDTNGNPFTGDNMPTFKNPTRFDVNGLPLNLPAGRLLGLNPWGLNYDYTNRPAEWPELRSLGLGKWVLEWKGRADVRLSGGSPVFLAESNCPPSGIATNGRRVYRIATEDTLPNKVIVFGVDAAQPPTSLNLWLPDPADPQNRSLERPTLPAHQRLFHPSFLARLNDRPWSYIRMMDLGATNNSPVRDWSDRRPPGHVMPQGVLNPRDCMAGRGSFVLDGQSTGIAYEHMVALCNQTSKDLWITVPHLSTSTFATKLARLIRFGSDGIEPYSTTQADPVWPPLNSQLKVYVEYSNEIWNAGAFGQGAWAFGEADAVSQTREQLIASRSSRVWQQMEAALGKARVVRVGAIQTGSEGYSRALLEAWSSSGNLMPEVMAVTTYFGHNLQYYADAQGWFKGRTGSDPYWTSPAFAHHLDLAFDQWEKFLLEGTAAEDPSGRGDNVADAGGIPLSVARLSTEFGLPMITYEGGGNFFTNFIDRNSPDAPEESAVTTFMEALNRHPRFAHLTRVHLEFARSLGVWSHMPFVLASGWGRFGQWGHIETMDQLPSSSPKYQAVLDWFDEHDRAGNPAALRHPNDPLGAKPAFSTPAELPLGSTGQPYSQALSITGGNGVLTWTTLAVRLPAGLVWNELTRTVSGSPTAAGNGQIFGRIHDADGDPAWRLFTLRIVAPGGPLETFPIADASVIEFGGNADTNFGGSQQLNAINPLFDSFFSNPPNPASTDGAKSYIKFDLTALRAAGLTIATAELELHPTQPAGANARVVAYATANENWTETGITFNQRPTALITAPAVTGQAPPGLHAPVTVIGAALVRLPLTGAVKAALASTATTFSVVIAAADFNTVPNFGSRDHFDPSLHPRLKLILGGIPPDGSLADFSHISEHQGQFYLSWPAAPGLRLQRNITLRQEEWLDLPQTRGQGAHREVAGQPGVFFRLIRD